MSANVLRRGDRCTVAASYSEVRFARGVLETECLRIRGNGSYRAHFECPFQRFNANLLTARQPIAKQRPSSIS